MVFTYELIGIGWADSFIELNNQKAYFSVSYLTNALEDLLSGLLHIIPGFVPVDELKKAVSFVWHAEPGGVEWHIEMVNETDIRIIIFSYEDVFNKEKKTGVIKIETECNAVEFIREVIKSLDKLLIKHGLIGYRETWCEHDFPITSYLKFKHFLTENKHFAVEEKIEDGYKEISISSFEKEMSILNNLNNNSNS